MDNPKILSFRKIVLAGTVLLMAAGCARGGVGITTPVGTGYPGSPSPVTSGSGMNLLLKNGGRVDWLKQSPNSITYDALDSDGQYEVYVMDQDGGNQHCITCSSTALPKGDKGNPAWSPDGKYIVFQAAKSTVNLPAKDTYFITPGQGIDNDLWLTDSSGSNYWKLVTTAVSGGGILHPHFSADGSKLLWTERLSNGGGNIDGIWALKVGDFAVTNGTPVLSNIKSYQPLGQTAVYESHGFSPDGTQIIFTSSVVPATWGDTNIYAYNLQTAKLTQLTTDKDVWNEHAHYSPDGKYIIWASSKGNAVKYNAAGGVKGTGNNLDLWIMNSDGSNKQRLTNVQAPGNPGYEAGGGSPADGDWSADGTHYVVYMQRPADGTGNGEIWILDVPNK